MTSYNVVTSAFKSLIGLLSSVQVNTVTFTYNPEHRNVLTVRAINDAKIMLVEYTIQANSSNDTEDTFTIETAKAKAILPLITEKFFDLNITEGAAVFNLGNITRRIGLATKVDNVKVPSFETSDWVKFYLPSDHLKKVLAAATFSDFFTIETNEFNVTVSAKGDNDDISATYDFSDDPAMQAMRVHVVTEYVKAVLANVADDLEFSIKTNFPVCLEHGFANYFLRVIIAPRIENE